MKLVMKVFGASSLLFTALMALTLSTADASTLDEKTVITFRQPVAAPGQVLTPGTYVFRLADSASDRNMVQVFTKDERRLLGTFLAIPDYRTEPSDRPLVRKPLQGRTTCGSEFGSTLASTSEAKIESTTASGGMVQL